jgi:spore coat polysaccharide biosynthesis protein SpsF (cytidylyltransferase family)
MELKTLLITQARFSSTRLPGKVLKKIDGKFLLQIHLERIRQAKKVSDILVATTTNPEDYFIFEKSIEWGFKSYRGSENDVLDRFYQAAKPFSPNWIVRVTSDCPLLDPALIDHVIEFVQKKEVDYGSNIIIEHFPDGQDIEVFTFAALEKAWKNATKNSEREHVTPYIKNNSSELGGSIFTSVNYPCNADFSKIRMTVDEERDFKLIEKLINDLGMYKSWTEYTEYMINNGLISLNQDINRNDGYLKSLKNDNNG